MYGFLEYGLYSMWWEGGKISRLPSCRGSRLSLMSGCVMSGPDRIGLGSELVCDQIGLRAGLEMGVVYGCTSGLVSDSELEIRVHTILACKVVAPLGLFNHGDEVRDRRGVDFSVVGFKPDPIVGRGPNNRDSHHAEHAYQMICRLGTWGCREL